ncbi:aldehyde dehydrogenase family protein [uncultured Ruminococcus sp.]|uniref:aldehyde dehydrogenase family protein n=1 Tax=uncultured Ruminococcus sp. TaxID=165186 RepID=UPI00260ECECB|nr:aldehyde dehydrogenase family protein [uncultured Ruminococcus sp.]
MSGYTVSEIHDIVEHQRKYFRSGETLSIDFRIRQLKKLKKMIVQNEAEMIKALNADLGRHETESYICDVGSIILEINEILHGLKKWAKPETHFSGLACFPSLFTKVYKMPYGVSLIISPFNFPFLLSLGVLAASIAGGNTSIIKASSKSVACTELLEKMVSQTFPEKYVKVIGGGHDVADICLDERVDKIFYTGSTKVGVHVLNKASKNLTPVALELGGENGNWCIIRKDADLKDAARKIAFFKMLNSGQVCININQVAVEEEAADKFVSELKKAFISQIGDAISNDEYPKLINRNAYEKCALEVDEYRDRVVFGGNGDPETNKYAPTIIYPVNIDEDIIKHELFNPILPILKFNNVEKLLETISEREHGLALYVFTKNIRWAKKVMSTQQFGGGCINEVCLHLMTKGVPFNGTGHSGMGAYHGEWGFREFTHPSTVLIGSNKFNMPLREHPYSNNIKMRLLKFFEK